MQQVPIYSCGQPGTFSVAVDDPYYWLLRLCYEECVDRYNCSEAGLTLTVTESTDFSELQTDVESFKTGFASWLSGLVGIDDGSNPSTRGLPAGATPSWTGLVAKVMALVAAGTEGLPAILGAVAIDVFANVLTDIFAKWLQGTVYPSENGSMDEVVKVLRKALLIDPGVLDFERSVFVGEKGGTGFWGLAQGDFTSVGQLLLHALFKDTEKLDSSVFLSKIKESTYSFAELLSLGLFDDAGLSVFAVTDDDEKRQSVFSAEDAKDIRLSLAEWFRIALASSTLNPVSGEVSNVGFIERLINRSGLTLKTARGDEITVTGIVPVISSDLE